MKKLVTAALACLALSAPALAQDAVTFQANWLIQGENAYMIAGREKGFFKEAGIDLSLQRGFGSGDTVKKIVTNAATIGTADIGVIMLGRVREGLPVKCISAEYTYSPQGFWTLAASPIKTVKDLAGKRVGITPGNSLLVYFPLLAKANGIDPASVTFVNMEASALLPTLLAGQVDAMPGFSTVFALRNADTTAQGKPLHSMPMAKNGVQVYGECQFVTEQTAATKGDLLKRYLGAVQKSWQWSRVNPDETAKILSAAYPELKEESVKLNHLAYMDFVFNETSQKVGLGGFDVEQLQRTWDALKEAQKLTQTPDVSSFIDTRFLPGRS
jgi:NitT/TauT family transport system substrate-binding protein